MEEENVQLRNEASLLAEQTDEVEQQEQKLVLDFASQLATTRADLNSASEDAEKYREECRVFKRLSDNLTDKLQQTEQKLTKVSPIFPQRKICGRAFAIKDYINEPKFL